MATTCYLDRRSTRQLSLVATGVLVVAVVFLLVSHLLFARGTFPIVLQAVAGALMLWARVTFGGRSFHAGADPTEGGLVTTGPYRFIRHPIYAAILLFLWAGIASHGSIVGVLSGIVATGAIAVRIGTEESLVVESYPEYVEYARRTKRIIPFVL
ncbi:MAG TPA: isoprenylcysteine carboxylmethyltransferase family protein [Candidatus Eisenbacteria bacterium]|nr:isoprenylcysteine carboxylmethyltransferase family protein [Candidatus Eisenbacteria bacterium]